MLNECVELILFYFLTLERITICLKLYIIMLNKKMLFLYIRFWIKNITSDTIKALLRLGLKCISI